MSAMVSVAIGTAGAISAYFYGRAFSSHSLNELDPIKGLLLPLSYCLPVFGCGLVFWLLVLLWPKGPKLRYTGGVASVHSEDEDKDPPQEDIGEVATLNTAFTTVNLWGCLALASKQQLPLLVHSLILFQLSSNLALLLIWASVSIRKYILSGKIEKIGCAGEGNAARSEMRPAANLGDWDYAFDWLNDDWVDSITTGSNNGSDDGITSGSSSDALNLDWVNDDGLGGITSRSNCGSEVGGREESGCGSWGDGGGGGGGEGRGDPEHGREESGGGSWGDGGGGGGSWGDGGGGGGSGGDGGGGGGSGDDGGGGGGSGDDGGGGGGSGDDGGGGGGSGDDGGGGGGGEGRGDPEHGVIKRKDESSFKVSKMSEMSITLTAQTSVAVLGFHLTNPTFSTKVLFVLVMVDHLVGYLCGLTGMLLQLQNPRAARVFASVSFACSGLGYILMTAMFLDWYLVLIAVLFVGIVSIISFQAKSKVQSNWQL